RDRRQFDPLSPQFLYWHMRTYGPFGDVPPGWENGATKLGHARKVLVDRGICSWSVCPYMDQLSPDEPLEGTAPDEAATRAAVESRIAANSFYIDFPEPDHRSPGVARMIYDQLQKKQPVAIAIPVFYSTADPLETNWDNPATTSSGEVFDPVEGD